MVGERLTQGAIEVLTTATPDARLTGASIEGVVRRSPNARFNQSIIEAIVPHQPALLGSNTMLSGPVYPAVRGLTWPIMKTDEWATSVPSSPNAYEVRIANMRNPIWHFTLVYDYLKNDPNDVLSAFSPYTDYESLRGFLLSVQGQFGTFLFNDPSDNTVGARTWQPPLPPGLVGNYYPLNFVIIDPAGHLQKAIVLGTSGRTIPTFNDAGGNTIDGGVVWADQGLYPGNSAQQISLLTDAVFYYSPLQRNFGGQFLEDVTDLNTTVYPLRLWLNALPMQNTGYQILGPGLTLGQTRYFGAYIRFFPWRSFNTQQIGDLIIDPSTHVQQAQSSGLTGNLAPAWNDSGGTVLDGGVLWQDMGALNAVTTTFNFYFRVRLESDSQDMEQFMGALYTIGGQKSKNGQGYVKLRTSRPNPFLPSACEVYPWNV